jgi:membrane fusion protein (multidrug efflux system)
MKRLKWKPSFVVAAFMMVSLAVAGVMLTGCSGQQQPPQQPVPEVAVVTVQPQVVVLTSELPGRTSSFRVAEIRPQVNGLIEKRLFVEGSDVEAGQVLYQIDPDPFQAALDNASANLLVSQKSTDRARAVLDASIAALQRHQSTLKLAKTNLQRYENLVKTSAASAMERDQAANAADVAEAGLRTAEAQVESDRQGVFAAEAAIKQAEAALETARINLDYTKITAPISGRIGPSNVTEGAIVTAYQPAPLATIQQFDPMYVDVPQSTVQLSRLKRSLANGRLKDNGTDRVKIVLEDDTVYPLEGSLKFRDVTVDPTTGSVILRIVVPNPDAVLLPGMFVQAVIDEGVNDHAILIPQQAVSRDPKGNPLALIVDAEGKVQQRALSTDRALGDQWLVSSGLSEGDRVIVEGVQRARPGAPAKTVPFEAKPASAEPPDKAARVAVQSD